MPYREFEATLTIEQGKIVSSTSTKPDGLYSKQLIDFVEKIVMEEITPECQSGQLHIISSKHNVLIVASGEMKKCRQSIIRKIREVFSFNIEE